MLGALSLELFQIQAQYLSYLFSLANTMHTTNGLGLKYRIHERFADENVCCIYQGQSSGTDKMLAQELLFSVQ